MKVFLTGGTGYTGSIVIEHLVRAGHRVIALARRPPARGSASEVEWVEGSFEDAERIGDYAHRADAAIHIGASHDADMERLDRIAIGAIAEALEGTGRAFLSTSATPVYGDTGLSPRDEQEPIANPHPLRAWRMRHDQEVVALSRRGVRGVVIRPPYIYGRAGGLLSDNIKRARATGKSLYIGDGNNWNSTVHVDSLAQLYLLALERDVAVGIYNAASDEIVRSADIAETIAACYGPGIVAEAWPIDEARNAMGELADLAAINCVASSDRARSELGWAPIAPAMLSELVGGSYRREPLLAYHER